MDTLRTHWRGQLRARLEQAVADMQAAGIAVEIGWGPVVQKAKRELAAEARFVDDYMVLSAEWR